LKLDAWKVLSAARENVVEKFSDLNVWKEAYAISLEIHRETLNFPKEEQFSLSSQIRRASKSICANLAEGFSKQSASKPEFRRFIQIAMGSSNEMMVWVMYCKDLGYISEQTAGEWLSKYDKICRMLNTLYSRV